MRHSMWGPRTPTRNSQGGSPLLPLLPANQTLIIKSWDRQVKKTNNGKEPKTVYTRVYYSVYYSMYYTRVIYSFELSQGTHCCRWQIVYQICFRSEQELDFKKGYIWNCILPSIGTGGYWWDNWHSAVSLLFDRISRGRWQRFVVNMRDQGNLVPPD